MTKTLFEYILSAYSLAALGLDRAWKVTGAAGLAKGIDIGELNFNLLLLV